MFVNVDCGGVASKSVGGGLRRRGGWLASFGRQRWKRPTRSTSVHRWPDTVSLPPKPRVYWWSWSDQCDSDRHWARCVAFLVIQLHFSTPLLSIICPLLIISNIISSFIVVYVMCHQECVEVIGFQVLLDSLRPRSMRTSWGSPGATFLKLLRKILGRFLILGKSWENIPSTNLELANNNTIITVINSFIFCVMLAVIMWRCF